MLTAYGTSDDDQDSPLKFFTLVLTSQPANAIGVIGGQASFTFTAITNNPTLVTYQWQIQTTIGGAWQNLVEAAGYYENVATITLTVKAIDNYLATRTALNFRCQALFSGSVPTFTAAASLTIPIHTSWTPMTGGIGFDVIGASCVIQSNTASTIVTGFSGPFTYAWTSISGAAMTCSNPAIQAPQFTLAVLPSNAAQSTWRCTISNGVQSVATDILTMYAVPISAPLGSIAFEQSVNYSTNGDPFLFQPVGTFVSPWTDVLMLLGFGFAVARGIRRGTEFAQMTAPTSTPTGLTLTPSASRRGGTAFISNVFCVYVSAGLNNIYVGGTLWDGEA